MFAIKCMILLFIVVLSSAIGFLYSQKFVKRVNELKEMKSALSMFQTKVKYTYEPIPDIFLEISQNFSCNISNLFRQASEKMQEKNAGEAWRTSIESTYCNLTKEDKNVLKSLGKMLGKTDTEGQIKEVELTETFLDLQIEKAEQERRKNEKLYKTLGVVAGFGFVIILV